MDASRLLTVATLMLAFSTFLGALIAIVSILINLNRSLIEMLLYAIIYIDLNLIFLYYIRLRWLNKIV
ncbi:hypothetical protein CMI42_05595 [Candidatus Pacearchaeota archaeon]|jgi:hypothetical protein|nr:hypothetical protein [Candidatus Pacearchaeota archaeon]